MDPWHFSGSEKLQNESKDAFCFGKQDAKSLIVYTSTFLPFCETYFKKQFDEKMCLDNFAKMSLKKGAQVEQIELVGANHSMQSDYGILRPVEDAQRERFLIGTSMWPHEKYMTLIRLNGYVAIDFLGRAGIIDPSEGSD